MDLQPILELIDAGGTIAVLVLLAYGFYTGKIVSQATLSQIIAATVERVLDDLAERQNPES